MMKNAAAGLIAVLLGVCVYGIPRVPDVDSYSYQRMAEGRMSEVVRPYANRVLHPLVVHVTGGSFLVVAAASLLVALTALSGCLADGGSKIDTWAFACLLASPVFCLNLVNIYIQDLFVMALTALFFWSLVRERFGLALLCLFFLQMARESTLVIAGTLLAVEIARCRWVRGVCVVAVMACAILSVGFVSRQALDNIHAMNGFTYLAAKVCANGLENILGVVVWSDTYARQLPHYYPLPPVWQMNVPAWLPLGGMKVIGIYRLEFLKPLELLTLLAGSFGVLPVLLATCRRAVCRRVAEASPAVTVAAVAGAIFFLLSPFTGRTVERYVGYAWPLFWLALPWVWRSDGTGRPAFFAQPGIWGLHLACMWWPVLLTRAQIPREWGVPLGLAGVVICLAVATKRVPRESCP